MIAVLTYRPADCYVTSAHHMTASALKGLNNIMICNIYGNEILFCMLPCLHESLNYDRNYHHPELFWLLRIQCLYEPALDYETTITHSFSGCYSTCMHLSTTKLPSPTAFLAATVLAFDWFPAVFRSPCKTTGNHQLC